MSKLAYFILGLVAGMVVMWFLLIGTDRVQATQDTCPSGDGWVKVEDLSGYEYTYTADDNCRVVESCHKAGTHVEYGTGATVEAKEYCDWEWIGWKLKWVCKQPELSHASFKVVCEEPEPTPTPVPPTPTPTPTPEVTPTPTPPVCNQQYSCNECWEYPNDDWCGEYKYEYCVEEYNCHYEEATNGDLKIAVRPDWVCDVCEQEEPTPTPTPTPTSEPKKPEGCTENCNPPAPVCSADAVVKEPANPHIYRLNGTALVKWVPTGGNLANVYYKDCAADGWQHAVQVANTGYTEIHELTGDVCFAIEQVNDCGGGVITAARSEMIVDGATATWVLFR